VWRRSVDRESKGGANFRHTTRRCFSLWLPRSGKAWEDRPGCAIHGWCCSPLLVSTGTSSYVSPDSSKNRATLAGRSRAGTPAADAPVLVALWLDATVEGWVRARELERLAQSDAAYRFLAGGVPLNYHALVDFRFESVEVLDRFLTQSVTALIGEGLVKLVETAVDGTKIRASASKQSFKTGAELLEVEAAVAAPRTPRAVFSTTPSLRLPPGGENLSSRKGTTAL
jgi:transposase